MLEAVGLFVRKLIRIEYAGIKDTALKTGSYRPLTDSEIRKLKSLTITENTKDNKSAGTERTYKKKNRRVR
jgi:hypothetical protein